MEDTHYSFLRESAAFRTKLFEAFDLEYNLDYVDSSGTRHQQTLADISYEGSNIPNLVAASFQYLPHDTSDFNTDRFVGDVTCEISRIGTRLQEDVTTIMKNLACKLETELEFQSLIYHVGDKVFVQDIHANTAIEFSITTSPNQRQYKLSLSFPTDNQLKPYDRYDDAKLAADLWAFLHDFAANLSIELGYHSSSLGRFAFQKSDPQRTLRVGVPRAPDCCRFGLALLHAQDTLSALTPESTIPRLPKDLDYEDWDNRLRSASDDIVTSIARRSITLARGSKEVSNEIISSAATAEITFGRL